MLDYLHAHSESVVMLKELADQVHLSERLLPSFRKMTGKTITKYLEEYRVNQSFSLVQERSVSDDPDRRYGRLQQCQPFCLALFGNSSVQSRRIQFFERR